MAMLVPAPLQTYTGTTAATVAILATGAKYLTPLVDEPRCLTYLDL